MGGQPPRAPHTDRLWGRVFAIEAQLNFISIVGLFIYYIVTVFLPRDFYGGVNIIYTQYKFTLAEKIFDAT